ncbi:MAG TPA: copper homeostasis protein CutC [Candidatus Acidoferrum sp.]
MNSTKRMPFLLEIAVESLPAAQAAQRAGAGRIELCANLSQGGLTPTAELMRQVRAALHIPIFAMIRPRPGNFVYTDSEFAAMQSQISQARELAMDGIVLGILTPSHHIDIHRTAQLIELARPLPVTFHRAFDEALRASTYQDSFAALDDVIATGAARLLTSGAATTAPEGATQIRQLIQAAANRIIVMPGAGIQPNNFPTLRRITQAQEFHAGLGTVLPYNSPDYSAFESQVRQLTSQKSHST